MVDTLHIYTISLVVPFIIVRGEHFVHLLPPPLFYCCERRAFCASLASTIVSSIPSTVLFLLLSYTIILTHELYC